MSPSTPPNAGSDAHPLPAAVRQLLGAGEEVEVRYELKGAEAYATATRLIILRDGVADSFEYRTIAGLREVTHVNVWLILCGVALFALGGTSTAFPVAGAALLLLGIMVRARELELLVTGRREPVRLNGVREVMGPLTRRLTERGARPLRS